MFLHEKEALDYQDSIESWRIYDKEGKEIACIPRGEYGRKQYDMSGLSLRGAKIRNNKLSLAWKNFIGTDFRDADLAYSSFFNADLRNADLCGADLTGVDFGLADLRGANLTGAKIKGIYFGRAQGNGKEVISLVPQGLRFPVQIADGRVYCHEYHTSDEWEALSDLRLERIVGVYGVDPFRKFLAEWKDIINSAA